MKCTYEDINKVLRVMLHDSVFDYINDDGSKNRDTVRIGIEELLDNNIGHILMPNKDTVLIFFPVNSITYDIHTAILKGPNRKKAFENIMPQEVVWRPKAPIEVGTGTTILPSVFDLRISDIEFNEKKTRYLNKDRVVIRNKEHLYYYEIYRNLFGIPCTADMSINRCPDCGAYIQDGVSFCRTCGAYSI